MSLKSAIALIVCFILFSEKKYHRALVYPFLSSYSQGAALLQRRVCAGRAAVQPGQHTPSS